MRYPKAYKRGRYYYFIHRDAEGKRHKKSTGCERRTDADEYIREFIKPSSCRPIKVDAGAEWILNLWYRFTLRERIAVLFVRFEGKCQYCGAPVYLGGRPSLGRFGAELDHIVPISKGGDDSFGNCTLSCKGCNAAKRDKNVLEFKANRKAI